MKSILAGGIMAGVLVSAAMAEGERKPQGDVKRPPGGGERNRAHGENMKRPPGGEWERPHGENMKRPNGGDMDRLPGGERPKQDGGMRPPFVPPEDMFKHMDRDGDGRIAKREFFASPRMERLPAKHREAIFGRLDRDGDGFLGPEEIRAMRRDNERRAKEGFRKLDTDQSGGLSFDEFSKGEFFAKLPEDKRRQIFDRMDTDGNGEINGADKPKGPPEANGSPDRSERHPERSPED